MACCVWRLSSAPTGSTGSQLTPPHLGLLQLARLDQEELEVNRRGWPHRIQLVHVVVELLQVRGLCTHQEAWVAWMVVLLCSAGEL